MATKEDLKAMEEHMKDLLIKYLHAKAEWSLRPYQATAPAKAPPSPGVVHILRSVMMQACCPAPTDALKLVRTLSGDKSPHISRFIGRKRTDPFIASVDRGHLHTKYEPTPPSPSILATLRPIRYNLF